MSGSTRFLRPKVERVADLVKIEVTLIFRLTAKWMSSGTTETAATIRTTLQLGYQLGSRAPEVTDEELADFALCYGPFHGWGYWREFVQSSLARLELPTVTAPLFRIEQAPQMVVDRLD